MCFKLYKLLDDNMMEKTATEIPFLCWATGQLKRGPFSSSVPVPYSVHTKIGPWPIQVLLTTLVLSIWYYFFLLNNNFKRIYFELFLLLKCSF